MTAAQAEKEGQSLKCGMVKTVEEAVRDGVIVSLTPRPMETLDGILFVRDEKSPRSWGLAPGLDNHDALEARLAGGTVGWEWIGVQGEQRGRGEAVLAL